MIVLHAVLANGEIVRYPVLMVWHGTWVVLAFAAYMYIRVLYRWFGPLHACVVESVGEVGDDITKIMLKPQGRAFRAAPGQFIYVSFEADAVSKEPHPYFTLVEHYSDEADYVDRAYLESIVDQPILDCLFLVCGTPPLMAALRTQLTDAGVSARQVVIEDFEIR